MLSGDNGILQKATDAKTKTDEVQIRERIQLAYHSALTGGQGSYTKESLEDELEKEFTTDYSVEIIDQNNWKLKAQGQQITIPAGTAKTAILQGKEFWQGGNLATAYGGNIYTNITGIVHSETAPSAEIINNSIYYWSSNESTVPVYFWIDNNIIYYWSEADIIFLNTDCSEMFSTWSKLQDISGLKDLNSTNVTNMYRMFMCYNGKLANLDPIKNWDVKNVRNMSSLFEGQPNLTNISELKNWNVTNVENMSQLFNGCSGLTEIDLTNWNTQNVSNMSLMFTGTSNLSKIYASEKFITSQVTNSVAMFGGCTSLVGGNGTTYDGSKIDATMAHIDTAVYEGGTLISGTPGYFTAE